MLYTLFFHTRTRRDRIYTHTHTHTYTLTLTPTTDRRTVQPSHISETSSSKFHTQLAQNITYTPISKVNDEDEGPGTNNNVDVRPFHFI